MKTAKENEKKNGTANGKTSEGRDRILEAAEKLFIDRGFDGVSVNDVAVRADVAKALIFYHFNNKQELYDAILDRYYSGQAYALMSAVSTKGSIKNRVHAGIDAYLDFIMKNPGYPRLIQGEICTNTRGLDKIMEHMAPLNLWGDAVFGRSLPAEGPLSPRHFFISIFGMIVSYFTYMPILKRLWEDDPMDKRVADERREHIHLIVDTILDKFIKESELDES